MRSMNSLLTIGIAVLAATAGGSRMASSASTGHEAILLTPPGITVQELRGGRAVRGVANEKEGGEAPAKAGKLKFAPFLADGGPNRADGARGAGIRVAYADANGRTLYTYDKDVEQNKSVCMDKCAEAWPPVPVPAGTKAFGDWSIVNRGGGARQWAYKGKPLYAFAKDTDVGERKGDGIGNVWHSVKFEPTTGYELPFGIGVESSATANGYVLADNREMTIYAFSGKPTRGKPACGASPCSDVWVPLAAAQLSYPAGGFSLIDREDGITQWAYNGKPLYTYDGDALAGDANGMGVDKNYQAVVLARNFIPSQASIRLDNARGPIVATAKGMTLYRRDTSFHQPDGHGLPGSAAGGPFVGRAMGTNSCKDDCLTTWRPFVPAANAQPSGYWEIMTRADGTRQWAYKGFALYTYTGDKKPGDKTGHNTYDIMVTEDLTKDVYAEGPVRNTTAATMYWAYAEP